jgi:hypothetical protein
VHAVTGSKTMSKPHEAFDERVIDAAVTEVLTRYAHVIPPGKLDDFRRSLEFGLRTHPYPQLLLKRMRPRGDVKESGTVATELVTAVPTDAAKKGKEGAR